VKIHGYFLRQKYRPINVVFNDILFMAILAGDQLSIGTKIGDRE